MFGFSRARQTEGKLLSEYDGMSHEIGCKAVGSNRQSPIKPAAAKYDLYGMAGLATGIALDDSANVALNKRIAVGVCLLELQKRIGNLAHERRMTVNPHRAHLVFGKLSPLAIVLLL
jgi:hypothetical protein